MEVRSRVPSILDDSHQPALIFTLLPMILGGMPETNAEDRGLAKVDKNELGDVGKD